MVSAEGIVKIVDLGLGGVTRLSKGLIHVFKTTVVGKKSGTFFYRAPETFFEDELDVPITTACDIYALGLIMNQIFSGTPPIGYYQWTKIS